MENSKICDKLDEAHGKHDEVLQKIFLGEKKSVNNFFDAIFGFFLRNSPETIFDSSKYYGMQLITSNYERWQKQYMKTQNSPVNSSKRSKSECSPKEDMIEPMDEDCWRAAPHPGGPTYTTNTATTSSKRTSDGTNTSITGSKEDSTKGSSDSDLDFANGALLDKYGWTQSIEDVEARIIVPKNIRKGSQAKVEIEEKHLKVSYESESDAGPCCIIDDHLPHAVKVVDSVWLISPGQHISVLLEKCKPIWWDRLLKSESPIDLSKLNLERAYSSLPEEDRKQIEKVISDTHKKDRGEPTSSEVKMNLMLRKAWDAEGSPFKGQPFDPSIVNIANQS